MKPESKKLYRYDFFSFARKALLASTKLDISGQDYLELMSLKLEALLVGETKRLIINLPPRHLKTWLCSVAFPAFFLARNPSKEIIIVCHNVDLPTQITNKVRAIFSQRWFKKVFPEIKLDHSRSGDFRTTQGGGVKAITIDSGHAGLGADLLILDDVLDLHEWNKEERKEDVQSRIEMLFSRFNRPNEGLAVFVAHRLHEDDPSAALLATGDWDHLCLPFCAVKREEFDLGYKKYIREAGSLLRPDAYGAKELELARRSTSPPYDWLYQQGIAERLVPTLKRQHIRRFRSGDVDFSSMDHVLSIDPSQKGGAENAHNAILVWATDGKRHYLRERFYQRCRYPVLKEKTLALAKKYNVSMILIEDTASGSLLIDEISGLNQYKVEGIIPKGSKLQRLYDVADVIAARKVFIPEGAEWADDFLDEVVGRIRKGSDQLDATTQYLRRMKEKPQLEKRQRQTGIVVALGSQRTAGPISTGSARVGMASRSARNDLGPGPGSRHPELQDQTSSSGLSDLFTFDGITVKRYR